jgi:hypothetical protein
MAKVGRPLKFNSPEELQSKIDEYFSSCGWQKKSVLVKGDVKEIDYYEPKTITGLSLALDIDRKTLVNYKRKEEFFHTIKKARQECEKDLEVRALANDVNTTMAIFSLKNNYDWKDKTEQDLNVSNEPLAKINSLLDQIKNDRKSENNKGNS